MTTFPKDENAVIGWFLLNRDIFAGKFPAEKATKKLLSFYVNISLDQFKIKFFCKN